MDISDKPKVTLKPLYHKEKLWIGLYFKYNDDLVARIAQIPFRKYSKTYRCWYLPYTKSAYYNFIKTDIPFIVEKHNQSHIKTRLPQLKSSLLDLNHSPTEVKEVRKLEGDIAKNAANGLIITWQAGLFFIKIPFRKEYVEFLRSLQGAYWHKQKMNWVCRGNLTNLNKLTQRFTDYWSEERIILLKSFCAKYEIVNKVSLIPVRDNYSIVQVKILNSKEAINLIKSFPKRVFDKVTRQWTIPKDRNFRDRLEACCDHNKYKFIDNVTWEVGLPINKSQNGDKKLRSVLQNIDAEHYDIMKQFATVFIRENYSFSTMKQYVKSFYRFKCTISSEIDLSQLPMKEIQKYLDDIATKKVSYQELNRHISAIKFYYKKIEHWQDIRLSQIVRPRRPRTLPSVLSLNEIKRLFEAVVNKKHRCMLYLAYGSGLRAGEIITLRVSDINVDRRQIFVKGGKGKKDRVVMIPKLVVGILYDYLKEYNPDYWLFTGLNRSFAYSASSIRNVFKRAITKAGLPKHHKLHNLRHSFATHLMENGTQQRLIQKLLGHNSSKTTEIYTHVSKENILNVVSPLDSLYNDKKLQNE